MKLFWQNLFDYLQIIIAAHPGVVHHVPDMTVPGPGCLPAHDFHIKYAAAHFGLRGRGGRGEVILICVCHA